MYFPLSLTELLEHLQGSDENMKLIFSALACMCKPDVQSISFIINSVVPILRVNVLSC
jgi:hypothetical protein